MVTLFGVWDYRDTAKPWLRCTRDLNAALRSINFNPKQRHQKNIALLFSLAQWCQRNGALPKKSLAKFSDCGDLFELLRLHGQVAPDTYGFCDLTAEQLHLLEKRLWHYWRDVGRMVVAMNLPGARLQAANESRRKPRRNIHNGRQPVLSATLKQFNS